METTAKYIIENCILGVDPGIRSTGWGIVRKKGHEYRLVDSGEIQTPEGSETDQLGYIYDELKSLLENFEIKAICVESIFFQKNVKTAMKTAKVIGVVHALAHTHWIENVNEVNPQAIKAALTGSDKASKKQMVKMANKLLKTKDVISHHTADAIGAAICGHMISGLEKKHLAHGYFK